MNDWSEFHIPDESERIQALRKSVKDLSELEKLIWKTPEGFQLNSFYTSEDVSNTEPIFYHRDWEIRQLVYIDKIMAANQAVLSALNNGANSIVFKGNYLPSEKEFNALFKGVHLDWFSSYYDFGESNPGFFYTLIDYFTQQSIDVTKVKGGIYHDPLIDVALQGGFNYSEKETFSLLKTMLETTQTHLPQFRVIALNTHYLRDAGSNACIEIAVGLSQLTEYVHRLTDLGLSVSTILQSVSWNTGIGADYFIEIAKYRALHSLMQKWLTAYQTENISIPVNAITINRNKTMFDYHNNILRSTSEAMAAAIGGADAITVAPFDDVTELPNEFSYRLSRNLQLILKEEAWLNKNADPSSGSYYLEVLTQKIEEQSWELFLNMESQGGYIASLKNKFIQQKIELTSQEEILKFNNQKRVLVGTNKYVNTQEVSMPKSFRESYLPEFRETSQIVPLSVKRLSEKMELERMKLVEDKAQKEN